LIGCFSNVQMKKKAYAQAGVDIDLGNRVKATLPELLASTRRPGVLGKVGGFGGLFALDLKRWRKPVLVSSTDGVGTKLKVAFITGRHDTIGEDLVNHCVNDIAVVGAEPLFFLDYIGAGKLEPSIFTEIIRGFARGCAANKCALIGGETAQMPGFYQEGEYDVSGTIVGVVDKDRLIDGPKRVRRGDLIIGFASSGLHTNGYSLARRILFETMKLRPDSRVADLGGSVADALLAVHVSYGPVVQALIRGLNPAGKDPGLHGLAHITGGGFIDNIPRILPKKLDAIIRRGSWEIPPLFTLLGKGGSVDEHEMYEVFNMGVGMAAVVAPDKADFVLRTAARMGHAAWVIGDIAAGSGKTRLA
jgi:phosphoribosylformylglycinamidine cyclo-ligase